MAEVQKFYYSYEYVHKLLGKSAAKIKEEFKPDVMVAIGGGGFIPARILRTFLRVPMLAVGIEFYSDKTDKQLDAPKKKQWLDDQNLTSLKGKRVLVVDEVDDTRTTLEFCVAELQKHNIACSAVFVIHNKKKAKRAVLPAAVQYYSAEDIDDIWIVYPWEATDIDDHTAKSLAREKQLPIAQ